MLKDKSVKLKSQEMDLTTGVLWKQILVFSIPLMMSNLLQVLFNISDIAVVGKFAGPSALGSVGSTTILVMLLTGIIIGVSGGINVLVALAIGLKSEKDIRETVHSAAIISVVMGVLLLLSGVLFARPVLVLLHTKEVLLEGAVSYLQIYCLGMPALALYNFGNAVFSAAGNTKKPLVYLIFSGVINIILNLFLVIVCHMGVYGVAIASIVSQYLSAVLIVRDLFQSKEFYGLQIRALKLTHQKTLQLLKLGVPAGLQMAIFCIANLFVQMGVNSFDATVVAGNSAAANADNLVNDIMTAFYTACASFMGQNIGANQRSRIKKSYLLSLFYSFTIALLIGGLLVLFGKQFLLLFTSDEAVAAAGMERLTIMGLSYCFSAFMDCTISASRALGKAFIPTVIVILGSCVFRVIWIYTIFAYYQTTTALYLLYIFSWTITAVAEIIYFIHAYRNKMRELPALV